MNKILVLIRHAHRDVSNRAADNSLSEKGREQSAEALKHFKKLFPKQSPVVLSSPKKRCQETVDAFTSEVQIEPSLLEQGKFESPRAFLSRMKNMAERATQRIDVPLLVLCSHGDALPLLMKEFCGVSIELKKGSFAVLEEVADAPFPFRLTWLIQPQRAVE